MSSIPSTPMPHKLLPQVDPATFEHDARVCALGYDTACQHCRARFFPDEYRQAERVSAARVAIVAWLTRLTGTDPDEVCQALGEIVRDANDGIGGDA